MRPPTYLRVVVTTSCPLSCDYCHFEGDPQRPGTRRQLDGETLSRCLGLAVRAGVRKVKLLGGEPLVRPDLPEIVAALRRRAPHVDLSVITSGAVDPARAEAVMTAGLDRINVSIHGFTDEAFARRGGRSAWRAWRQSLIERLCGIGRMPKLNYVYTGAHDDDDLTALLDWAAPRPVVVNILDDLGDPGASAGTVLAVVERLRGRPVSCWRDDDPDSLPTTRLRFADGLVVEIKTETLGSFGPWPACRSCPVRARCREGIFALRLTHDGRLQACMDRPDLSISLVDALAGGEEAALAAWQALVADPVAAARGDAGPRRLPIAAAGVADHAARCG